MGVKFDWKSKTYTISVWEDSETFSIEGMTPEEEVAKLAEYLVKADAQQDTHTVDLLEMYVADICNDCDLPFMYTRGSGKVRKFTPIGDWQPSYGCEWEQSAQEGYDYGWDI